MKRWTKKEIEILKNNYKNKSKDDLLFLLKNRTWNAIGIKASKFSLTISKNIGTPTERFWAKVDIKSNNECWNWTGIRRKGGYNQIRINKKNILTHRFSWELHFSKIPDESFVLHKCNNPSCVNPNHLKLGTHEDNMKYMIECNRQARCCGENNGNSKLTINQVKKIRILKGKFTQKQIAKIFDVKYQTISDIHRNKIWRHVI